MENAAKTVDTLNDLIKIHNDRIMGYERATKELGEGHEDLKELFTKYIGDSHKCKMTLATEVQTYAKDVENTTSASGDLHRAWLDVKGFFSGHNPKSVLEECEFGEDATQKAYKTAMDYEHLPAYIKDILAEQQVVLKAAHDHIKQLRDSQLQEQ